MAHREPFKTSKIDARTEAAKRDLASHGISVIDVLASVSSDPIHQLQVLEQLVEFVDTKVQPTVDVIERRMIAVGGRLERFGVHVHAVVQVLHTIPPRLRLHILDRMADRIRDMTPAQRQAIQPTQTRPTKPTDWAIQRAQARLRNYHETHSHREPRK